MRAICNTKFFGKKLGWFCEGCQHARRSRQEAGSFGSEGGGSSSPGIFGRLGGTSGSTDRRTSRGVGGRSDSGGEPGSRWDQESLDRKRLRFSGPACLQRGSGGT